MRSCAVALTICLSLGLAGPALAYDEDAELEASYAELFAEPELKVRPSPAEARELPVAPGETVADFDVSPLGPDVFQLIQSKGQGDRVRVWSIDGGPAPGDWPLPKGFSGRAIALHPRGGAFFLSGVEGGRSVILRVEMEGASWRAVPIFRTDRKLRRLSVGPRPFMVRGTRPSMVEEQAEYRLFFGRDDGKGGFGIRSITERGGQEYQVIGDASGYVQLVKGRFEEWEDPNPARILAPYALPLGFRPRGDVLLWQDREGCFNTLGYERWNWVNAPEPLLGHKVCGGSLTSTPNGLGLIHWQKGRPGVDLYLGEHPSPQAQGLRFLGTPSSVPDGRGLVGLTATGDIRALVYTPIEVPLADVTNAWQYAELDADRMARQTGLFRPTEFEQMYELYESELYASHDRSQVARPYLVTTDVMWEVFAAAYEGLFVVQEREHAIPAFWAFVDAAAGHYQAHPESPWASVFVTLKGLHEGADSPEIQRIRKGDDAYSEAFGREAHYAEACPRSHYTLTPGLQDYFRAFKYLVLVAPGADLDSQELAALPEPIRAQAREWIGGYLRFIAPPRRATVWQEGAAFAPPAYLRHPPDDGPNAFPLSWGIDNEVLHSVLFHPDWPEAERMVSRTGEPRILPSGLDLAAALGSPAAWQALTSELGRFPRLGPVLKELHQRFADQRGGDGLYARWMDALAVQWADRAVAGIDPQLWATKRLQTGLGSWTTLRHATLLVNERGAAEAGEGGFETIVMRPPLGQVEPDPATFEAIAGLFDAAHAIAGDVLHDAALREGVQRRLAESAAKSRAFARMAEKQLRGEALDPVEYGHIQYVARIAEHHFLLYKSLANPVSEYAIAVPDPMARIADVAGGKGAGDAYLLSAVGLPLEWDQIVPFFGRRQIVKGAVYSYYEMESAEPVDDEAWRARLPETPRPAWVTPWITE